MILAAGLLVLLGLGLFVAGLLTGVTALYWACVAVCVVAAVLLVLARRQMTTAPTAPATTAPAPTAPVTAGTTTGTATTGTSAPATAVGPSAATTTPAPAEPPVAEPAGGATAVGATPAHAAPAERASAGAGAAGDPAPVGELDDPPVEEVEVTDLLLVVDVKDEVLVVDERPRYHLAGCIHLAGRTPIPLPLDEAKTDGFTPCAVCEPDRNLAQRVRTQRSSGRS